jgi:hypothetical protein
MTSSQHAQVRAQQRCIPPLVVEWLLAYGRRTPSHGAIQVSFDKRARRELSRDVGKPMVSQVGRFLNTALVVDPDTDQLITVMWRS